MQQELANYYKNKDTQHPPQPDMPRDHPLIGLLHPGDAPEQHLEQLRRAGITFSGQFFALAHLQLIVGDAFAFVSSQDGCAYSEDQLVVAFTSMAQPILKKGAYLFEIQREIILLVSGETAGETAAALEAQLKAIRQMADGLSGIRLFVVYSDPGHGLTSIAEKHDLCRQLRQWRVFHLDITPILGPEVLDRPLSCNAQGLPDRRDIALEQAALQQFKAGRFRQARDMLRQLFESDYLALAEPLLLLKHKCVQYLSAWAAACCEICGTDISERLQQFQPERRLLAARTYPEVRAQMEHCFGYLNDLTLELRSRNQSDWILEVQNYVRANFSDPNLNVNTIADHFGKNAAYVSRSFLRQTGASLLEYIHRYRIQEAKIRIGRGDPLVAVASAVGYGSVLTMSRAFKKYEGTTPGKLR